MGGSTLEVDETKVNNVQEMNNIFVVEDESTVLRVSDSVVEDNAQTTKRWVAAKVDGGTAEFLNSRFQKNEGFEYLFSAENGATINLADVNVIDAKGGLQIVSDFGDKSILLTTFFLNACHIFFLFH